jgi:hypothetical protein
MAIPLYLAGSMLTEELERIATALRHQNYQ